MCQLVDSSHHYKIVFMSSTTFRRAVSRARTWIAAGSWWVILLLGILSNYINPGSQIPQVEARKCCSRDLFNSSGRATALIDRHFWYTFLQKSMTRSTNTAILLTYAARFHWRFSGNWQEHIRELNIRGFGSPGHLSLGSDRLNATVCRTCTVPLWDVKWTVAGKLKLLEKHPWMTGVTFIKFPTSLFHRRIWYNLLRRGGPNDHMTVENIAKDRESAHSISLMAVLPSRAPAPNVVWLQ